MGREERISQLKTFLENEPQNSFLRYALAIEFIGEDKQAEARQLLEALLSDDPEYTATYYHLGKLMAKSGEKEAALKLFEMGMEHCRSKKEQHNLAELQSAYNNLMYDEDDF